MTRSAAEREPEGWRYIKPESLQEVATEWGQDEDMKGWCKDKAEAVAERYMRRHGWRKANGKLLNDGRPDLVLPF